MGLFDALLSVSIEVQHIAHSFRTDSAHLIDKARTAYDHSNLRTRSGFMAKVAVDLFMAMECALKSLLCSRNFGRDPEAVLAELFRCGHDLRKLLRLSAPRSILQSDCSIIKELNRKGVSLRYDLDLFALVTCDFLESDSVSFQIDGRYLEGLFRVANLLSSEASEAYQVAFPCQPRLLTKHQLTREVGMLRELKKRSKKKC